MHFCVYAQFYGSDLHIRATEYQRDVVNDSQSSNRGILNDLAQRQLYYWFITRLYSTIWYVSLIILWKPIFIYKTALKWSF